MKISVITVCKNAEEDIENTLKSVISQSLNDFEYIVIDGGSTDKTEQIIKKYRSKIDVIESGPDKGIYDAMNKGILKSTGDWIFFINSGDTFAKKQTLYKVIEKIKESDGYGIFYGDVITVGNGKKNC